VKSLFEYTAGKSLENLTTAFLSFVCSEVGYESERAAFAEMVGVDSRDLRIASQSKLSRGVLIDLMLSSRYGETQAIIENKFDSGFTWTNGEHQLVRYAKWLLEQDSSRKILIVLTIARRVAYVKAEISEHLKVRLDQEKRGTYQQKCEIAILEWEKLLGKWNSHRSQQTPTAQPTIFDHLLSYIDSNFVHSVKLTEENLKALQGKDTGEAVEKLFEVIDKISEHAKGHESIQQSTSSSFEKYYHSYGFGFRRNRIDFWFGFWPKAWRGLGAPLFLQIFDSKRAQTHKKALLGTGLGFSEVRLEESASSEIVYLKPIELKPEDIYDSQSVWNQTISLVERVVRAME